MTVRLHSKVIAALLAPALIVSGAAQGMLLMRCGPAVRMSCCCPKAPPSPGSPTMTAATAQCCGTLVLPVSSARATLERAVPNAPAPMWIAAVGEIRRLAPALERVHHFSRHTAPPGPSPVLANCALLI